MRASLEWLALPILISIVLVWCGFALEIWAAIPVLGRADLPVMLLVSDLVVWLPLGVIAGFLVSKMTSSHRLTKSLLVAAISPVCLIAPMVASSAFVDAVANNPSAILSVVGTQAVPMFMILLGVCSGYGLARGTSVA